MEFSGAEGRGWRECILVEQGAALAPSPPSLDKLPPIWGQTHILFINIIAKQKMDAFIIIPLRLRRSTNAERSPSVDNWSLCAEQCQCWSLGDALTFISDHPHSFALHMLITGSLSSSSNKVEHSNVKYAWQRKSWSLNQIRPKTSPRTQESKLFWSLGALCHEAQSLNQFLTHNKVLCQRRE